MVWCLELCCLSECGGEIYTNLLLNNTSSRFTCLLNIVQKKEEWGPPGNNAGWGDPRSADPRTSMDPRDMRSDPRDIRAGSSDPMRLLDPRDQMRLVGGDMRGDPRGITGRLNGAGAEFWGQGGPHAAAHNMHHQNKMQVGPGNGSAGWEEPSPPAARRNTVVPSYDDGTSLWGTPSQPQRMGGKW